MIHDYTDIPILLLVLRNSYLRHVKHFLPITTAMAPSANPKTRIRGATNNFPAGRKNKRQSQLDS